MAERPAEPQTKTPSTPAEYEAIKQALMETARGRWFLDEFARTNRNADTATVLAAVARLEQALIDKAPAVPAQALADTSANRTLTDNAALFEALKNIEGLIATREQLRPPVDRNLQKLQDMIWALREGGADGRVCNLLAAQTQTVAEGVATMETSMTTLTSAIADLWRQLASEPATAPEPNLAGGADPVEMQADQANVPETIIETPVLEVTEIATATAPEPTVAQVSPQEAAQLSSPVQSRRDILDIASPAVQSLASEPRSVGSRPSESLSKAASGDSLGAAILASGLMSRAAPPPTDPLAPLRRMSQSEKIALFT